MGKTRSSEVSTNDASEPGGGAGEPGLIYLISLGDSGSATRHARSVGGSRARLASPRDIAPTTVLGFDTLRRVRALCRVAHLRAGREENQADRHHGIGRFVRGSFVPSWKSHPSPSR